MSGFVARTGRLQQRYEGGFRLIAGMSKNMSLRFVLSSSKLMKNQTWITNGGWETDETAEQAAARESIEEAGVRGDLVHFLGFYAFRSKKLKDEFSPEGLCKAAMYALLVKEELESWPEKSLRQRSWLKIPEAIQFCKHSWMREALEEGFSKWYIKHNPNSTIE
ncbi:nudix hydrolase 16, mitochondrial-like [Olea europaea var. sylvestris]|uniref:nudix hydrolase 16, mitochondrial-like n=1 Tax=Olea europaea var. sylvestris TaxID=158386 RepID=UPI000C1D23EE|nr:nudix hydrolase 16, mitochondrial-like [Olea europaea var. sylvestris]